MNLFDNHINQITLPLDYEPLKPRGFKVEKIILAKGSLTTPERENFVRKIIALYPEAEISECPDKPHNRVGFDEADSLERHKKGKRTLVFGELKTAVRFSEEEGNACPNYWHFSPYGFCPYGCKYCYLAGTKGVWFSPAIKIYVNLPEMLQEIDKIAMHIKNPTAFYLGKLQDGLALDSLTGYSRAIIPFFAEHKYARMTLLTKSDNVENLLNLDHKGNTILSWSVNPPEIAERFEENTPSIESRLTAMKKVAEKGYPIRAVMMPIIPVEGWQSYYYKFTRRLIAEVPLKRLTLGGVCIYPNAQKLMESKMSKQNPISAGIKKVSGKSGDGRNRYSHDKRREIYSFILDIVHKLRPDLELALCLEDKILWEETGLRQRLGHCNCVL